MGAITDAATAKAESGFDPETGELRIGDVVYRPRRYTRELRVAHRRLQKEKVSVERRNEVARISAKYQTDATGKVTGVTEALTEAEALAMDEMSDLAPDLSYHALPLLFADKDGNPPTVEDAMRELVDEEASDAEDWVTSNPTGRKTKKSSA